MLPNFGNNFVKSRPIFKILLLLERELNLKQKSQNMFTSTRLKKNPQLPHIQDFNITQILHSLSEVQVETLLFNKLLIFSHLLLEMSHLAHAQARIRRRHSSIALSITPCSIPCQTSNKRCFSSVTS